MKTDNIRDELDEIITLNSVSIIVAEYIPFGANQVGSETIILAFPVVKNRNCRVPVGGDKVGCSNAMKNYMIIVLLLYYWDQRKGRLLI